MALAWMGQTLNMLYKNNALNIIHAEKIARYDLVTSKSFAAQFISFLALANSCIELLDSACQAQ